MSERETWETLGGAADEKRTSVSINVTPSGRATLDAADVDSYVSLELSPERAHDIVDGLRQYLHRQP
jgi:hypothetical protein